MNLSLQTLSSLPERVWGALRPRLSRVKQSVRRSIEHTLHPPRRRAARARLAASGRWERVLVLCYGNVCRSPYTAAVLVEAFRNRGSTIPVIQGGFVGPGRQSPVHARTVARAHGIELGTHISRLVTATDFAGQTLVVVMDGPQARRVARQFGVPRSRIVLLGDLDPQPIVNRTIKDPWGLEQEVFEEVYQRISNCTLALADCLRPPMDSGSAAAPGDDAPQIRSLKG